MYACQIYQAAAKDLPSLDEDIAAGKFAPLRTWLNEKVHKARAAGAWLHSVSQKISQMTGSRIFSYMQPASLFS